MSRTNKEIGLRNHTGIGQAKTQHCTPRLFFFSCDLHTLDGMLHGKSLHSFLETWGFFSSPAFPRERTRRDRHVGQTRVGPTSVLCRSSHRRRPFLCTLFKLQRQHQLRTVDIESGRGPREETSQTKTGQGKGRQTRMSDDFSSRLPVLRFSHGRVVPAAS